MDPVQRPRVMKVGLVTVKAVRRNNNELVRSKFEFRFLYLNMAFAAKRIEQDIIIAPIPSFPVVIQCLWKIPYVRNKEGMQKVFLSYVF